jgi:hypothetical protein
MRRRRRPDLLRPDRGLQARMVLAAVCTPLIVLACAAAIVVLAPFKLVAAFAIAAAIGIGGSLTERRNRPRAEPVTPAQAPELHAIVDRLCVSTRACTSRAGSSTCSRRPSSRPSSATSWRTSSTATPPS